MSLPWVVRRSLSPSTEKGTKVLRNIILKENNRIQWERIMELMAFKNSAEAASESNKASNSAEEASTLAAASESSSAAATKSASTKPSTSKEASPSSRTKKKASIAAARTPEDIARKQKEYATARQAAMKDAVGTLLGSTNGRALRGVLKDLDTPDLIWKLGSREGRPILKMGIEKTLSNVFCRGSTKAKTAAQSRAVTTTNENSSSSSNRRQQEAENYRPVSEACKQLREKQSKRTKLVTKFLIRRHLAKCLLAPRGIAGTLRLMASTLQITMSLVVRSTLRILRASIASPTQISPGTKETTAAAEPQ